MSLPAVGDVVTAWVDGIGPVQGKVIPHSANSTTHDVRMDAWWAPWSGSVHVQALVEFQEGVRWLRGAGPEIDQAIRAAIALMSCIGDD